MGRRGNTTQIKEQKKPPESVELEETEINNLSETEFRTLIIRMFKDINENIKKIEKP